MSDDSYTNALAALTAFQVTETTVGDTLHRIAEVTLEAVPAASVAGMSMLGEDEQPTTAIYTDEDSPEIDAAQYREGKGPCLDAWRTQEPVLLAEFDDEATAAYPGFVAACLEHGIASTLSLPMVSGDTGIGALNLYSPKPDAFSDADQLLGRNLAAATSVVLANVSAYWTAFDLSENLNQALQSRAVIEQAKGILMAGSRNMTADEAFDLLRKASQRENVKLNEIARRIVERRPPPNRP
ncbi:MAG: GAF and ANTAR domain-containing protein [Acidimicrobiales bacterium]|nr:GAF and ANTAR domain-containing protein [Acidimicrobiales bacterium]